MRMMSNKRFFRFESLAQRLVEGSMARLLGERPLTKEVVSRLADAVEDSQEESEVANHYQIRLHPADYAAIHQEMPDLTSRLTAHLRELGRQMSRVPTAPRAA